MVQINKGDEIRPKNASEETAGGWNYGLDRSVSQANNQQGQYNALNGTGHVAGMPQTNGANLNLEGPQIGKKFTPGGDIRNIQPQQGNEVPQYNVADASSKPGNFGGSLGTPTGGSTQPGGSRFRNANINLDQYGDDSSPDNQSITGGRNEKYTGEGVKTSNLDYDPNITTAGLDPNYVYGMDAQYANSDNAGYIARRNDNIASALYNEAIAQGRNPTKEDVINFLSSQKNWNNSTEADRLNTIESVWKRLGGIANEAPANQNQPAQEQTNNENPTQGPGMDLQETPGGVIYGRAGGDANTRVETQADPYSAEAYAMAGRQTNYNALQKMNSYDIAVSVTSGYDPYGSQAMRDLMQYDPSKYQEIQNYIKQIQGEENINNIATNGAINAKSQTEKATDTVNNSITSWVNQNSNERNSSQVQSMLTDKLANSQVANNATQEMLNLNAQMADIQERMANLPNEAKKAFKGDVPQYIVDAYVSNNTQRLQSELNKLQSRYNGAIDLYKTELSQKQWETEMELKQRQFNSDQNYRNWQMSNADKKLALDAQQQYRNQDYMNKKLRYDNIQEINGSAYVMDENGNWTRLSDDIAYQSYKRTVQDKIQAYMNMFPDGADGGQCEQFTDAFTYTTTGLKMEGANGRAYTTAEEKKGYVNTWVPEVGSVAVFDYGIKQNDGQNYGHTMLVTGYDPNTGIVTLKGSNKSKKPGEYEKVYTQTMTLSDLNSKGAFQGFWNPYLDKVADSYQDSTTNSLFARVNTPMATMIDTLKSSATTAGQLTEIAVGEQMYNTMYELQQGGYLDKLISAGVVEDFINGLDRKKFGKQSDERGSEFLNQLGTFIRNEVKDEEVAYAMNRLYQLVEQKLRKESGAAISSSEWAMDFQLFLPQPGQSDTLRRKQLEAWDDIIYKQLSGAGMKSNQYVPIFDYTYGGDLGSGREIR